MDLLQVERICKTYGSGETEVRALKNVSFSVSKGEFVAIVGESGSGKSTLLNMIGALDTPTSGSVYINNMDTFSMKERELTVFRRRNIGFIFQAFHLIPELTVEQNIIFPVLLDHQRPKKKYLYELLDVLNLKERRDHLPNQLSGGQQQRVAIARALANEPKVLLLDEPLGALDLKLRKDMQVELKKIQQQTGITFVFVTHDQEEALSMSDTVVVMDGGDIQQIGTPTDIYNEPKNAFVADFIGESNILDGVMLEDYSVRFAGHTFRCLDKGFGKNTPVDVVIRPEDIDVVQADSTHITGEVTAVTFKGVHYEIIVDVAGFKWMIQSTDFRAVGDRIGLSLTPDDIHVMAKSEYSGMFGDYSTFSDEMDEDMQAGGEEEGKTDEG